MSDTAKMHSSSLLLLAEAAVDEVVCISFEVQVCCSAGRGL